MKRKRIRVNKSDQVKLEKLKALIEREPGIKHSLQSLSKEAGISRAKLIYIFKHQYKTSIHRYLMQVRMNCAYTLLTTTDMSIKEIAARVGYSSRQNFTTAFRNHFWITSAEVQRRKQ